MEVFVKLMVDLVVTALVTGHALASTSRYQRIHENSEVTFNAAPILTTTPVISFRCFQRCHLNSHCLALTWDSSSMECNLFNTPQVTTVTPSPDTTTEVYTKALSTYSVISVKGTWLDAQARCQAMGAVLAFINDQKWLKNLKIAKGIDGFFIGGHRSDANSPWYDQENNLLPDNEIDWSDNDLKEDNQHCMASWGGGMNNVLCHTERDIATICKTSGA